MADVKITYKGEERTVDQSLLEDRPFSPSAAKEFRKSPKHFVNYLTQPRKLTKALLMGQLVDTLALTPQYFDKKFSVFEKATGTGSRKINNEAYQKARDKGVILVTPEEYETALKSVEALNAHPMAKQLLDARTKTQVKLEWRDKENDIPCKGFVDFETEIWEERFIVDLKAMSDGDPDVFQKSAYNYGYDVQAGAYLDGYHKRFYKFPYFIFLVVETQEPFNVTVNFVDTKQAERCKSEWKGTLKALRYCIDNKQFDKGYDFRLFDGMDYFSFRLPGYAKDKFSNFNTEE